MNPREQAAVALRTAISEAETAATANDMPLFEEKMTTAQGLRTQIEGLTQLGEMTDWATKSAGMLPLATGQGVAGAASDTAVWLKAGESVASHSPEGISIEEEYGEGIYSPAVRSRLSTTSYRDAFRRYLRLGLETGSPGYRTLQEGADTAGGFLVPPEILNRIIAKEPTPTRVAGRVTQLTAGRDQIQVPRVNYTSDDLYSTGMRVTWTGEIPSSSTAMRVTDPIFGKTTIPVYTAMLSIPVTNDMAEDAEFPLLSWLSGKFGETIDLLKDNVVLNGSGLGQPMGILASPGGTGQPAVVLSGTSSVLTADSLIDVSYSLPEQYEDNSTFVMNKTNTLRAIAKFKDNDLRYLYSGGTLDDGLQSASIGQKRNLLGYPVTLSGFMPNIGSAAYPVIFGDLRGYYLVNRISLSLQVLRELYAETNQILILGRIRLGGIVAEDWRLKILRSHNS